MSEIQLIIVGAVVLLTILSTIIGLQVSFLFRDLKKVIGRMDKFISFMENKSTVREISEQEVKKHTKPVERISVNPSNLGRRFFKRKQA